MEVEAARDAIDVQHLACEVESRAPGKATKDVELYYDESDYYHLNMHHGHYDRWYLKRGAQKSVNKMIENIEYKIKVEEDKSESAKRSAEFYRNMLNKVKSGDMSVYI